MKTTILKDIRIESDESDEFISRLERSFGLTFEQMKVSNGMTLQNLFDNITTALRRTSINECTAQKVFFRLRDMLVKEYGYEKQSLTPTSLIKDVFPSSTRRKQLEVVARHFQIKMDYFQPPGWVQLLTVSMILGSSITLFVNSRVGMIGIIVSVLLTSIVHRFSHSLPFVDLGQLVKRVAMDNLVRFQNSEKTINAEEVKTVLISTIQDLHGLEDKEIRFDQQIVFA